MGAGTVVFRGSRHGVTPVIVGGGFTLVEVVVALAILSLVMLATISAFYTFANTQKSIEKLTVRVDEVRAVSSFLRDMMESAVAGGESDSLTLGGAVEDPSYFSGSSVAVEWRAATLFGGGYGGALLMRVGREGDALVLRWLEAPGSYKQVSWGDAESKMLVENLEQFEVSYRRELGASWQPEWTGEDVPATVRIQLKSRGRYWPELILRVQQ